MKSFFTFFKRVFTFLNMLLNKMFLTDKTFLFPAFMTISSFKKVKVNKVYLLMILFLFTVKGVWSQTTITTGNTVAASAITAGTAVIINAGGTLNMDVVRSFSTVTTANVGTSTISNTKALTVTGAITIISGNTLSMNPNATSGSLTSKYTSTAAATISGSGTLTTGPFTVDGGTVIGNNGNFTIGSTVICTSIDKNGGNRGHDITVTGILKVSTSISNINNFTCGVGSTVEYNGAAQTVFGTTYNNLTLSNSGLKTTNNVRINGVLSMEGTATASVLPTYGIAATLQYKGSGAQTTGVEFPAKFSGTGGVIINNANGVSLNAASTINTTSKLTLTSGRLTTTTTKLLSVTNTATTAISVGSTSAFIDGPVKWSIGVGTYVFPVGNGTLNYLPFTLVTSAASAPIITIQAFNIDAGVAATFGSPLTYISHTEYWQAKLNGGTFTGAITLTRQIALSGLNFVGRSTLQAGSYSFFGGTPSSTSINTSSSVTNLTIAAFYVMASNQNKVNSVVLATTQTGAVTYGTAGSVTYKVAITPNGGATTGSTTLSLTGTALPAGATSSFSTIQVVLPAGSSTVINVTLTIITAATTPAGTTSGITVSAANTPSISLSPTVVSGTASFVVKTQTLTLTATGPSKIYGTALIAGTSSTNFSVTGTLASGESLTSVTLTPNAAGSSATTAAGVAYVVTPSLATGIGGFLASNYNITYKAFNGTVTAKTLTVTATGPSKIYGTALTAGTSSTNFTALGTITGESVTSVTLTPNAAGLSATTAAGAAYVVTPSGATGINGFLASNYRITYTPFNGSVTAKALTITAINTNKTYGITQSSPISGSTAFTSVGLAGSETIGSVTLTYGPGAIAATDAVGTTSSITPSAATGGTFIAGNYTITYNNSNLTVTARVLIITASSANKTYGTTQSTPVSGSTAFTSGPGNLVNGETIGSVTLNYSTGALAATDAVGSGSLITPSAAAGGTFIAGNYSIIYNQGTLTVTGINQSAADYRSNVITGNFFTPATWQYDPGGNTWTSATLAPTGANNVTILSGHTITLDQNFTEGTGKTLLINIGGSLVISELQTLDVASGGTLNFNGQLVTVKSTIVGTGAIGTVLGTLSNATNVTVERFIATPTRAWRLLTIPATGAGKTIRDAWAAGVAPNPAAPSGETAGNGTLITGNNFGDGATATAAGFDFFTGLGSGTISSIRFYTSVNGLSNANTPNITTAPTQQGYMLYVRGDRTVATTGGAGFTTTLRPNGTINSGSIPVAVSASPFTMVGNPYAASINLDNMYNTGTNSSVINPTFYIWDATLGTSGAYRTLIKNGSGYIETISGDGVPYLVVNSGQAFFVVPNNGGSLTITESNKTIAAPQTLFRPMGTTGSIPSNLAIKLYQATRGTIGHQMDGIVARFNDTYNVAPTEVYDAAKINNFNENLSLLRDGRYLSVESRPYPTKTDTLFVPFWNLKIREYALTITSSNFAGINQTAILVDKFTNTQKVVDLNDGAITYPFTITSDTASSSLNRFSVVFEPSAPLAVSFTKINASLIGLSKVQVSWNTGSETGVKNYEIEKSSNGTSFGKAGTVVAKNLPAGAAYQWLDDAPVNGNNYYRIRSNDENGKFSYSTVAVVQLNAKKGIQVSPTLISNRHFTISLNDVATGNYGLFLIDASGREVYQKIITNAGGYNSQEIDLGKTFIAAGVYNLSVSDAKGNKQNFRLVIKN